MIYTPNAREKDMSRVVSFRRGFGASNWKLLSATGGYIGEGQYRPRDSAIH